jgi:predicted enzyme related to lactoylglutathione lyase
MAQVTGLGGAFLKAKDPNALYQWYERNFGVKQQEYGAFSFPKEQVTSDTVLAIFPEDSTYFGQGAQRAMLNLRVDDLDGLLDAMAAAGVEVDPKRDTYDFGKFGWVVDPEGNRIELWEPLEPSTESTPTEKA